MLLILSCQGWVGSVDVVKMKKCISYHVITTALSASSYGSSTLNRWQDVGEGKYINLHIVISGWTPLYFHK